MHHIFASEGWQQLLGVLLPKLLACQSLAAQPMLPFTALRLLALKPGAAAAADRQAAFEELLAAVGATPAGTVVVYVCKRVCICVYTNKSCYVKCVLCVCSVRAVCGALMVGQSGGCSFLACSVLTAAVYLVVVAPCLHLLLSFHLCCRITFSSSRSTGASSGCGGGVAADSRAVWRQQQQHGAAGNAVSDPNAACTWHLQPLLWQ